MGTNYGNDIYFINSSDGAVSWGHLELLMQTENIGTYINYMFPSMVVDGNGGATDKIYVVAKNDNDHDIYYTKSTDSGENWDAKSAIMVGSYEYPSITFYKTNVTIAAYTRTTNDIHFTNSTDSGATWTTPYRIDTIGAKPTSAKWPSITIDVHGLPYVFWQINNTLAGRWNIVYRNYTGDLWQPDCSSELCAYNLTTDDVSAYVNTKFNCSDNVTEFIWVRGTGTPWDIMYGTIDFSQPSTAEPNISVNVTSNTTSVVRGEYVNVTAEITCSDQQCNSTNATISLPDLFELETGETAKHELGDIAVGTTYTNWTVKAIHNGTDFINVTVRSSNSTGEINDTASTDDITVTEPENPKSCGSMSQGDSCTIKWLVNATGATNTAYKIDVNFSSNNTNVGWNDTNNSIVKITSPTQTRTIVQSLLLSPISSRLSAITRSISQQFTTSELLERMRYFFRYLTQSISLGELLETSLSFKIINPNHIDTVSGSKNCD